MKNDEPGHPMAPEFQQLPEPDGCRRNRQSNSFRDQIIRYLHNEKGFSWPEAEKSFRAVWQVISRCIRRGEVVELPGLGIIQAMRRNSKGVSRCFRPHHNIHTGKSPYRILDSTKRKFRIVFTPHPGLDLTPPPSPPSPAELEARQLAAELLGQPVNDGTMADLQRNGIEIHPHLSGALLRRLRELKHRGRTFENVALMVYALAELYWI